MLSLNLIVTDSNTTKMGNEQVTPSGSISDMRTQSTLHDQTQSVRDVSPSAFSDTIDKDIEKQSSPQPQISSPTEDTDFVTWSGPDDLANPQNWSFKYKVFLTAIWVWSCFVTTVASSIFSSGSEYIRAEYNVSTTVVTLGISLFLVVSLPNRIHIPLVR